MSDVIIVGFPKSGNTWLARLMGDVLHRPIRGIDTAIPLAAEGEERGEERGIVRQLHLVPRDECDIDDSRYPGFVASRWTINPKFHNGERVIHILRDPRDVSVAVNAYWGIKDIIHTIKDVVGTGAWPLWGTGWEQYINLWHDTYLPHTTTRYEWLINDTTSEVKRLLNECQLEPVNDIDAVVQRQSFSEKQKDIARNGENMPHGAGIQRDNLRKGIVGDWRNVFSIVERELAQDTFGEALIRLGYESNADWVN